MKKYTQQLSPLIFDAVDKLVDFVKPTYGPAQNKVILQKGRYQEVIDDGVATAKEFELENEFENAVVKLVKEVAIKTNDRVGDGTTSSLIMLQALMKEIRERDEIMLRSDHDDDRPTPARTVIAELKAGFEDFKKQITDKARQITTEEDLKQVAYISFNNEKMAEIIAKIFFQLGHDGIVTIEESRSMETSYNVVEGLQFPKGFASAYFINQPERAECVIENPYILVTDKEIYDVNDLVPLLDKALKAGKQVLILADDIRGEALGALVITFLKKGYLCPAVKAPYYANDKYEFLMDVAELTGANFVVANVNKELKDLELEDLGQAERVVITKESTTIIGGKGKNLEEYLTKMKAIIESTESDLRRDKMKERLAKLTSGVAVIKVGCATENEMRALRYKVEDAVNATRVAFKEGVVKGAGITLSEIETSSPILNKALKVPHETLLVNLEVDSLPIGDDIIDPVAVLIAGVESAISIVNLLITTKGALVDKYEIDKQNQSQM